MSPPAFSRSTRETASSSYGPNFRRANTRAMSEVPFAGLGSPRFDVLDLFAEAFDLFAAFAGTLLRSTLSQAVRNDCTASSARFGSDENIGWTDSLALSRIRFVSS